MKRVITFTSASCTGWCFGFDADDYQYKKLKLLVYDYISDAEWRRRNHDGHARLYESVEAAIADHHERYTSPHDPEYTAKYALSVTSLDELYAFYADDGEGGDRSLGFVAVALLSDPCSDTVLWPGDAAAVC